MEKKYQCKHLWHFFARSLKVFGVVSCFLVCMCGLSSSVAAQSYLKEISVKFERDSLLHALREINRLGGNCLSFRKEEVVRETKLVTLQRTKTTVLQVVKDVLQGTKLTCMTQKENIIIVPQRQNPGNLKLIPLRGSVKDAAGVGLPGATVMVRGTQGALMATTTDKEGKFSFQVPDNVTSILVSFVGYKTEAVNIVGKELVHVVLKENVVALDEVVSVGYYNVDKRHLTSAVTSLKAEDIMVPGMNTIDMLLEGHVPGMIFMQNSGQVGAAPKIKLRGTTTLLGNQAPLWVLDGIILSDPVDMDPQQLNDLDFVNLLGNAISGLNPEDIDQVDVLKDASATAIYGPRASNGVIVITTKKGKVGKPSVKYSISGTFRQRPRYSDRTVSVMNSKERIAYSREAIEGGLVVPGSNISVGYESAYNQYLTGKLSYAEFVDQVNYFESVNTDWLGLLMQDTYSHNHTLSISGGSQDFRYYSSIGYMDERGNIRGEQNKRYSAMVNLNLNYNKFSMTFGLNGNLLKKGYTPLDVGVMDYALNTSRAIPAYEANGDLWFYQKYTNGGVYDEPFSIINEMHNSAYDINTKTMSLNLMLKYRILPQLSASVTFSYGASDNREETYYGQKTHYIMTKRFQYAADDLAGRGGTIDNARTLCPVGGELKLKNTWNENYSVRANITYDCWLDKEQDHHLTAAVIGELSSSEYNGFNITRRGYVPDRGLAFADVTFDTDKMSAYMTWLRSADALGLKSHNLTNLVGLVGTMSYVYKNEYILNANMRIDASNKFGDQSNEKLLPIWSVSGRWNMHENLLRNWSWVNTLALKMSFGYQGNMSQTDSPKLVIAKKVEHPFFKEDYATIDKFPNPDLRWEKTATFNVDLEFALFKQKVVGTVGYYYRHTTDAFIAKDVSAVNGVNKYTVNQGELENHGVEWTFNFTPINTMINKVGAMGNAGVEKKGFVWRFNPNFGTVINQLIDRVKPKDKILVEQEKMNYNNYLNGSVHISGRPVNSFYSYKFKGLNPQTGAPMFYDVEKERGEEFITMTNDEILRSVMTRSGAREPFLQGGLNNYLGWNNFSFSFNLAYSIGSKIRLFKLYPNGGSIPSPEANLRRELAGRWKRPGDELHTNVPAILTGEAQVEANQLGKIYGPEGLNQVYEIGANAWQMYDNSDIRVVSGNYLKVQAVSLRYTLPMSFCRKLHWQSAYVNLSGINLYTFCSRKLKGQDPMQSGTSELINVSVRPTYSLQLNVTF